MFDIRNFLHLLEPAPERNKYFCPVCGGHNLSINPNTGAYRCWNGCACSDIRNTLSPPKSGKSKPFRQSFEPPSSVPVLVVPIEFSTVDPLPERQWFPDTMTINGVTYTGVSTTYHYSPFQWVKRFNFYKDGQLTKTFRQYNSDYGTTRTGKGNYLWRPYLIDHALTSPGNGILLVEGEKCVEFAMNRGVPATTFQGSCWDEWHYWYLFQIIMPKDKYLVLCPDNDATGQHKMDKVRNFSNRMGWYSKTVHPPDSVNDIADLGDNFFDWVKCLYGEEHDDYYSS